VVIAPSGRQVEIVAGDHRAVVVEVGGGLRSYSIRGVDVLDGYPADRMCSSGRGQVLMPWPNRLEDGSYEFAGQAYQLALSEAGARNAIHGLVRWATWTVSARGSERAVAEYVLHPQPGYPFTLALSVQYSLSESGLRVCTTATNVGPEPCPFGSGAHPYFRIGAGPVDSAILHVPARTVFPSDERGLPADRIPVEGTEYDFRNPRPVGSTVLDNAYTDLERAEDGLARIELRDPETGAARTLWLDASYGY
jgi:aldose 1-epimerase